MQTAYRSDGLQLQSLSVDMAGQSIVSSLDVMVHAGQALSLKSLGVEACRAVGLAATGSTVVDVRSGSVRVGGVDVSRRPPEERFKAGLYMLRNAIPRPIWDGALDGDCTHPVCFGAGSCHLGLDEPMARLIGSTKGSLSGALLGFGTPMRFWQREIRQARVVRAKAVVVDDVDVALTGNEVLRLGLELNTLRDSGVAILLLRCSGLLEVVLEAQSFQQPTDSPRSTTVDASRSSHRTTRPGAH